MAAPLDLAAWRHVPSSTLRAGRSNPASLGELCYEMTSIASPTGEELVLAQMLASRLGAAGASVRVSRLGEARRQPCGADRPRAMTGPRVWLYAPLDTAFSGNIDEDRPYLGDAPRADFTLPASREGGKVIGLGAENPKGFAAAGIAAFEAIARQHPELPRRDRPRPLWREHADHRLGRAWARASASAPAFASCLAEEPLPDARSSSSLATRPRTRKWVWPGSASPCAAP